MHGNTLGPFRNGVQAVVANDAPHEADDCFADEVVIDFPSVAPALDRIRRAFLSEESPRPLSTAIHLTARDALDGTIVPLSVPVHQTCGACGGRGESWTEPCPRCQRTGLEVVRRSLQVTVPPGVVDGTRVCFAVSVPHHPPTRIELHISVG